MARVDLYQAVTDKIVAELEKGVAPWVRPWMTLHGDAGGLPYNGTTGRPYRGVNVWVLVVAAATRGFEDTRWVSFKQCMELGGHVRKSERATQVVFWRDFTVEDVNESTGEKKERTLPLLRSYSVFNAAQCEGLPPPPGPPPEDDACLLLRVASLVRRSEATIRHGSDRAFYAVGADVIQVPRRFAFRSEEAYWGTVLHELTHWTAHPSRLARDVTNKFGSLGYAAEELIAELGSAYLCAALGVEGELQHSEYLGSWLQALKDDKRAFFRASSLAQKAADFVLQYRDEATD